MTDKLLKIAQVAKHFGVCTQTVRKWIADGELKAFQVGDTVRVRESTVAQFITQNQTKREAL